MIKIFTFANKSPELIEPQVRSFQKHLQEPFEFTVFNNAGFAEDKTNYEQINTICRALGAEIQIIDVRKNAVLIHRLEALHGLPLFEESGDYAPGAAIPCGYSLCWAWEHTISWLTDPVLLIHSDIFLTKDVTFLDLLEKYQLCFVPQTRPGAKEYMWEGLVLIDMMCLPAPETINWWGGPVNGVITDIGGQTGHYLEAHPKLNMLRIEEQHLTNDPHDGSLYRMEDKEGILHYRGASDWANKGTEYHRYKLKQMRERFGI
jgi:hypothetical protein